MEGRYAAEKDAEVMGEGGGGSRRSDGSEFGILEVLVIETIDSKTPRCWVKDSAKIVSFGMNLGDDVDRVSQSFKVVQCFRTQRANALYSSCLKPFSDSGLNV